MREYKKQPVLKMIGRDAENPALKAFIRALDWYCSAWESKPTRACS